jgi:ABC-type branched-subunit amino acid transport system substrate-binding protein
VCGRKLKLITGDDRTDSGQNRAEAQRLIGQAFGLAGGASIVDSGTADAGAGTDVPVVQVAVADNSLNSPNMFSPSPLDPTGVTSGSVAMWKYFHRSVGLQKVGIVVLSIASARARSVGYVNDIQAAGLQVAGVHEVGLAETNFVAVAQQLVNEGADGFIGLMDPVASARLAKAVDQIGWHPVLKHYGAQNYGLPFVELAGPAAEGTMIPLAFDIFEDTANPAVARFVDWFRRTAPGRTPDFYAAMGWASADMMVEALRAAGGAPTRKAVLGYLRQLTTFDAHGFLAPCNPAGKVTSPYFMVAKVENGRWRREFPATGFSDGS